MPPFFFSRRPASVPPSSRRSLGDDSSSGGSEFDESGSIKALKRSNSFTRLTAALRGKNHNNGNKSSSASVASSSSSKQRQKPKRRRGRSRKPKEIFDLDVRQSSSRNGNADSNHSRYNDLHGAEKSDAPSIVMEGAYEDGSLSAVAPLDELEQQQRANYQYQQKMAKQLQQKHPHSSKQQPSPQYGRRQEPSMMHWTESRAPASATAPGLHLQQQQQQQPTPLFMQYCEEEEQQEEIHYMVKKTTSRRNPNSPPHHRQPKDMDNSNTTYHYNHSHHPQFDNSKKQQHLSPAQISLMQTQLRDAQRVVRAVLNLGDSPLDTSASLRAIRHFASLQKDYTKTQKELQVAETQKRELEQQWTSLVLEKNLHILRVSQLQSELERVQLDKLKRENQLIQQPQTEFDSETSVQESSMAVENYASAHTTKPTTVENVVSASTSSLSMDGLPGATAAASCAPSPSSTTPITLFLDPSNSSASINNANNSSSGLEYQNALEVQLEECQALLRQRHDELQTLQEQLADARTQLLESSHSLTAQEEVLVLQQELEAAKQELDELEQERQYNMTEIVELNQQVLLLQRKQQQDSTAVVPVATTKNLTVGAWDESEPSPSKSTAVVLATTPDSMENASFVAELQGRLREQELQLEQIKQDHETRIQELQELVNKSQQELQSKNQYHEFIVQAMIQDQQDMENKYTRQIRKLATRAVEEQAAEKERTEKLMQQLQSQISDLQGQLKESATKSHEQKMQHDEQYSALQSHWEQKWEEAQAQLRELVVTQSDVVQAPQQQAVVWAGAAQLQTVMEEDSAASANQDEGGCDEKKQEEDEGGVDGAAASSVFQGVRASTTDSKISGSDSGESSLSTLIAQLKWQRDEIQRQHAISLQQIAVLHEELHDPKQEVSLSENSRPDQQPRSTELEQGLRMELAVVQEELSRTSKELQSLQADADIQLALQNQWKVGQQRVLDLENDVQRLEATVKEREIALQSLQAELERTKVSMASLEQEMGQLQAEMDAVAEHDVGQQLLHSIRAKRTVAAAMTVEENNSVNDKDGQGPQDDPFGSDQVDEKVALQATLFRTQAQLRRQEDMYRILADEADELRSTLASSQETMEDLEQQRNFNQVKVTELSRMIRLRGKLTDVEEQLLTKINQCASLTTQVDALNFKLQESQRKMERLEQERGIHMDKLKELGQIWESHALMLQAQKDMQAKVTEVIERWEASEARAEQMQMEREMSVERVTKLSFELAESRARVDELMEELDQERMSNRSLHGGSVHSAATAFSKRSVASTSSSVFWTNHQNNIGGGDCLDVSKHGTPISNNFFGRLAKSSAAATALGGTTAAAANGDDAALRDADTAAGVHNLYGESEDQCGGHDSLLTSDEAQVSTIRKLMKQIERLEDEKTRYADAVAVLESGLQQVQRENVVKSAKIMQMENQFGLNNAVLANNKTFDKDREEVVSQLKQTSHQFEGSMLALQAEMKVLNSNIKRDPRRETRNTVPDCDEPIPEKVNRNPNSRFDIQSDMDNFHLNMDDESLDGV